MSTSPDITLWFINASRAIRVAWLLEALELPYTLHSTPRAKNGLAPPEFKAKIPTSIGKSPVIQDGQTILHESGAILEYLCDKYDPEGNFYPKDIEDRNQCRIWLYATEGTFAIHSLAILYVRWSAVDGMKEYIPEMEENLSPNVRNDLKWLNDTLKEQRSKGRDFLVGDKLTIADMMMHFTILFMYERNILVKYGDDKYPEVEAWLKRIQETPSFKKTKEKTEFTMDGDFRK